MLSKQRLIRSVVVAIVATLSVGATTEAGTWETKASMPTARMEPAGGVIDGRFYVAGGATTADTNDVSTLATLEVYDPLSGTWVAGPPMQTPRRRAASAVTAGELYVIGGQENSFFLFDMERYDPATNLWTTMPPVPILTPTSAVVQAVGDETHLYVVGNFSRGVWAFDAALEQWTELSPQGTGDRSVFSIGLIDNRLYVIGGRSGNTTLDTVDVFDLVTNTWTTGTSMPTARQGACSGVIDGKLYVAGGALVGNPPTILSSVVVYDPLIDDWTSEVSMPTTRRGRPACAVLDGKLLVAGGRDSQDAPLSVLEVLDPEGKDRKTCLCHVPPGRHGSPRTICVGNAAAEAHLRHGDSLGECGD